MSCHSLEGPTQTSCLPKTYALWKSCKIPPTWTTFANSSHQMPPTCLSASTAPQANHALVRNTRQSRPHCHRRNIHQCRPALETKAFNIEALFGSGENVQVNGTFTYRSRVLGITKSSPFAIWCRLNEERKVTFLRFTEDTFGTASTFEKVRKKIYAADPDGHEVEM